MRFLPLFISLLLTVPLWGKQFVAGSGQQSGVTMVTTITSPTTSSTYSAGTTDSVAVAGTAVSDRNINSCSYTNSLGGSGTVQGNPTFSFTVALTVGTNVVTVTCTNAEGTTSVDILTITRTSSGGDVGNLWVDSNGGSCTYSATAGPYSDGAACVSLDAAVDSATTANGTTCGGVIIVKSGTYASQDITNYRSCGGGGWERVTTIRPENFDCELEAVPTAESDVHFSGGIDMDGENSVGAGYLRFCGLTLDVSNVNNTNASGTVVDNSRWGWFIRGSRYIWLTRNVSGGAGFFLMGFDRGNVGSGNLRQTYNLFEACHETTDVCFNGKLDIVENALIEGNTFHTYRSLANCTGGPPIDCGHWELLFLNGTKNVTISKNRGYNYQHSAAFYVTCSGPDIAFTDGWCHENLLVENNWLESPHNNGAGDQTWGSPSERGEAAVGPGHCNSQSGSLGHYQNIVIRNNTVVGASGELMFDGLSAGITDCTVGAGAFLTGGLWIVGNIANRITNSIGCTDTNVTLDYNIGTIYSTNGSNPCGANRHNSTLATSILVNPTWGNAVQNARLLSASTIAQAFLPETYCADEDYDGDARPAGPCAAGAFESEP